MQTIIIGGIFIFMIFIVLHRINYCKKSNKKKYEELFKDELSRSLMCYNIETVRSVYLDGEPYPIGFNLWTEIYGLHNASGLAMAEIWEFISNGTMSSRVKNMLGTRSKK